MSIWRPAGVAEGLAAGDGYVEAMMNYQAADAPRGLLRSGKVYSQRTLDGDTGGIVGVNMQPARVRVHDARRIRPSWRREGFELVHHDAGDFDFYDNMALLQSYYPQACELVRQVTGASQVFAFDHNIRSASGYKGGQRLKGTGSQGVQAPAHVVHGDLTLTSAPERLRQLAAPPKANDTMGPLLGSRPLIDPAVVKRALSPGGRFAFVNVWRPIRPEPVETYPLAVCDSRSYSDSDLVVFEIRYADRIGENYFAVHSGTHKWWYYPRQRKEECLVFKVWDSNGQTAVRARGEPVAGAPGGMCLHSAFADPTARPDAPDRESVEVRCVCIWEAEDSPVAVGRGGPPSRL